MLLQWTVTENGRCGWDSGKTAHLGKVLAFGIRAGDARAAGEPLRVGVPGAEDATLWDCVQGPGEQECVGVPGPGE